LLVTGVVGWTTAVGADVAVPEREPPM